MLTRSRPVKWIINDYARTTVNTYAPNRQYYLQISVNHEELAYLGLTNYSIHITWTRVELSADGVSSLTVRRLPSSARRNVAATLDWYSSKGAPSIHDLKSHRIPATWCRQLNTTEPHLEVPLRVRLLSFSVIICPTFDVSYIYHFQVLRAVSAPS